MLAEVDLSPYSSLCRKYHTYGHVERMISYLKNTEAGESLTWPLWQAAAVFHDLVYKVRDPGNNEIKSAEAFKKAARSHLTTEEIAFVVKLIMATARPSDYYGAGAYGTGAVSKDGDCRLFVEADWNGMASWETLDMDRIRFLDEWEDGIFHEAKCFDLNWYIEKREEFLRGSMEKGMLSRAVYEYVSRRLHRQYKVCVYAGSFCPFHKGHLAVLNQAREIFDKVIIAKGQNPKKPAMESNVFDLFPHEEVCQFTGQQADFLISKASKYVKVFVIRGLRNDYDLLYESAVCQTIREQMEEREAPEPRFLHVLSRPELSHVSSSLVRELPERDKARYIPDPEN